jgi:hypothetical protein
LKVGAYASRSHLPATRCSATDDAKVFFIAIGRPLEPYRVAPEGFGVNVLDCTNQALSISWAECRVGSASVRRS